MRGVQTLLLNKGLSQAIRLELEVFQKPWAADTCISFKYFHLSLAHGSVEFCEATPVDLPDEPKESLYGGETDRDLCIT